MPGSEKELRRAVIITALSLEYKAARAHLTGLKEVSERGTLYEVGRFEQVWEVVLAEIGMGNAGAAAQTERAIHRFKPEVVLFVGVAGGLKDVRLGDVVAATKVYGYESGKAEADFKPRPDAWHTTFAMEQRARAEARNEKWLQRVIGGNILPDGRSVGDCHACAGAIASGEKVLASLEAEVARLLKDNFGDALAVAMEEAGFLQAVHANQGINALVVRGISDQVQGKSEADGNGWQPVAARHACAFAFEILAKLAGEGGQPEEPVSVGDKVSPVLTPGLLAKWPGPADAIRIYYAYVDEDKSLLEDLQSQLIMLKRSKRTVDWEKSQAIPGFEFQQRLSYLDSADLVLVLVSSAYMRFITDNTQGHEEYQHIVQRRQNGRNDVIPIKMRPVADWELEPLGCVVALPRGEKAVAEYAKNDRDRVLMEIAQDIRRVVETVRQERNAGA